MKINQIPAVVNRLFDAGVSVHLKGRPGIGKTAIVRKVVADNAARDGHEWGYAEAQLASYGPVDMQGYMLPSRDASGREVATFTEPAFFTTKDGRNLNDFRASVLFFDEFNQADPDVKKAASTVLLERRSGNHRLNAGCHVVAASNLSDDRSGTTREFDHIINRTCEIRVETDAESWLEWAAPAGIRPEITSFAQHNAGDVFDGRVPEKQGPWCTPRSLHMLNDALSAGLTADDPLPDDPITVEMAQGMVGNLAHQVFATIRLRNQLPSFGEILNSPDTAGVPDKPDALMLVLHLLAGRVTGETMEPVLAYVRRIPGEFAMPFGSMAIKRDPFLVDNAAYGRWAVEHTALIQAVMGARL